MKKYALNLAKDNRILSAWVVLPNGSYDGMPIVEELPEGNVMDYRYENGKYVYDPLPEHEPPATTPTDSERIAALEASLDALIGGIESV